MPHALHGAQLDLFQALGVGRRLPGGTFTAAQVRNVVATGFQMVCALEGVGRPATEAMLAEVEACDPGWPGDWTEPRRIGPPLRPRRQTGTITGTHPTSEG
ncbi:MAG: hypothetical protein ACLQMH_17220 [Solirubrobacteraceae bacterium]